MSASAAERREALVERLADHVLDRGLGAASLRALAAASGASDRMLIYYFKDKANLIGVVLAHLMGRLQVALEQALPPRRLPPAGLAEAILAAASGETMWPYMRLWLEIAALAGRGDGACLAAGRVIAGGLLAWLQEHLDGPPEAAWPLLVELEGRLVLRAVGLEGPPDGAARNRGG